MSLVYGLDKEREEIEYNKIYNSHFLTFYGRASRPPPLSAENENMRNQRKFSMNNETKRVQC